jgi:hypothetical protein
VEGVDSLLLEAEPGSAESALLGSCVEGECAGFLVNTRQPALFGLLSTRHWFSIRVHRKQGARGGGGVTADVDMPADTETDTEESPPRTFSLWNLDSKLPQPREFHTALELRGFLRAAVQQRAAHVFLVSETPSGGAAAAAGVAVAVSDDSC